MNSGPLPQCNSCKRWKPPSEREDPGARKWQPIQICEAYPLPSGIPPEIRSNRVDHRQPYPGDKGMQWVGSGDRKFPEHSMPEYVEPTDWLDAIPKPQPHGAKRGWKKPDRRFF